MELITKLTEELGISPDQAKGGAGLLLALAKEKLGKDFSPVEQAVPDLGSLISSAPQPSGWKGMLGSLTGGLGGMLGKAGDVASLAHGFSSLGLDTSLIGKFIPLLLSYVQAKGGITSRLFSKRR